jgi:hypothetical protein
VDGPVRRADLGRVASADDMGDDENWVGGFYELVLMLGDEDDERLDRALKSLWRAAGARDCRARPVTVESELSAAALQRGHRLGDIAERVRADVPFRRALIGFEVDERYGGTGYLATLDDDGFRPATA